jgi:hypothetical protein
MSEGEYEDGGLLGCSAVSSGRSLTTFRKYLLPPSSERCHTLMMELARTSETSVNFYQTTRRYKQEDRHLYTRRRENFKSCLVFMLHIRKASGLNHGPVSYYDWRNWWFRSVPPGKFWSNILKWTTYSYFMFFQINELSFFFVVSLLCNISIR